jgi:Flp pilus assembly protein CpaB
MKPKTMILLGLAITCGLGASYMTSRLLAERQGPEALETVDILVAKDTISVHTVLKKPEDLFVTKTVAKGDFPDAITDFDALKGKVLKHGRARGESVTPANLYDKIASVEIPEGHQGIAIRVTNETAAEGLATLPGSRVDLQLTVRDTQNVANTRTLVLLENVLVVAAGINTEREGRAALAPNVLVALKRPDILKVNAAMEMGTIRFILRNQDDTTSAGKNEQSITGREILDGKKTEPIAQAKQDPTPATKVEPPQPDNRPKFTYGRFPLVNGTDQGQRSVEWVEFYQTEDGRRLPPDHPEVQEWLRSGETPAPAPRKKNVGPVES